MPDYDLGTARGKIEIDSSGATKGVGEAKAAVGGLDGDMAKTSKTLGTTGLALGGIGIAAIAGFGLAVNAAAGFEKGLSAIEAVSGASEAQMEGIRKKALQLGADTKFSAAEAAGAMEELVKAGLPLEAVMTGAADATVALAAAGEVDLKEAATIASNAMNQFHLTAKDMPKVADLIAGAANASAIDVSDFGMSLSQAGATANLVGLSFDDLSVAIAALGNAGIKGSDAGTSIKTFLGNLQPTTEKQTAAMLELGLVTEDGGNAFFDASGKIKSMSEIAGILNNATKGLTEQQKAMALETIFGSDAIRAAAIIADTGSQGMDKLSASIGKVSAEDVAAKRMDNLSGSIEQLKGSVETVAIQIGSVLLPMLKTFADFITKLVNKFSDLSPGMQKAVVIAGLLGAVLVSLAGATLLAMSGFLKARKSIKEFKEAMQALELAQKRQMIAEKARQVLTKIGTSIQLAFNAVMMANPIFLVIAALVALGVGLFILYKKFKPFQEFIDSLWQGIQKAFDVVMDVIGGFLNWLKRNWDLVLIIFTGPIGIIITVIRRFGDDIVRVISGAIEAVVDFFQKLPGRILAFTVAALGVVVDFLKELPGRAAYWLGFLMGLWIKLHIDLIKLVIKIGIDVIKAIVGFMEKLPGRVLGFLDMVWDNLYSFGVRFVNTAKQIAIDAVEGIITFIKELPGKVLGFLDATWDKIFQFGVNAVNTAKEIADNIVGGIVYIVTSLPGKVATLFTNTISAIGEFIGKAYDKAKEVGLSIFNGVVDWFKDLPGKVKEILGDLIQKIKDAALGVFNGAKDLGGKIWDGFKKGLFGSPHTKVEYAVWDMLDNVGKSIEGLRAHMNTIEGLRGSLSAVDNTLAVGVGAGVLQPVAAGSAPLTADQGNGAVPYIGELNINNPVGEPSEQSLTRTMQKLEYAGFFG